MVRFCGSEYRTLDFDSMEKYLHKLITVDGIMYSTFNRRAAGITFYLSFVLNLEQTALQKKRLQIIRQLYNTEEYLRLKPMRGVRAEKQEEVKEKSLTLECIKAVEKYIKIFGLKGEDYLVGSVDR